MTTHHTSTILTAAVLSLAAGAHAQNARLSVLTSWQPNTLFHVGVTCPDKSFALCKLFLTFQGPATPLTLQGVPIVVDPLGLIELPIVSQYGAGPTSAVSTEAKWRYDVKLPAVLPVGIPLHVQAVLFDTAGNFRLTNGVVGQTAQAGAHEIRYSLSNASSSFAIRRFDVDEGVALGGISFAKPTNAGTPTEPELSPDQSRCIVNFGSGATCIVELGTLTATWLPSLPTGRTKRVRPQFRAGQSDRFWVVDSGRNWQYFFANSSVSDWNYDLVCFSCDPSSPNYGQQLARYAINADSSQSLQPSHTNLEAEWSFDPTGTWACFVERQTYHSSGTVNSWLSRYAIGSTLPARTFLANRSPWGNSYVRATRDNDTVTFSDCDATGWMVRTAQAGNGTLTNGLTGVGWPVPRGSVTGGTLWTGSQAPLVVMSTSPGTGSLGSFPCPTGDWVSYRGIQDNAGGVVLAGPEAYHARPVCRIQLNPQGQAVREDVYCGLAPYGNHFGAYVDGPAWGGAPPGTRGRGVALRDRQAVLMLTWNVGTGTTVEGVCLLDTATMTHVSMRPELTPDFARPIGQSGAYITYLF